MVSMDYVKRLVRNFESTVRLHEMAGAAHPEDRPLIEEEYEQSKQRLLSVLSRMRLEASK